MMTIMFTTEGSKSTNQKRINAYCLASITLVELVHF